MATAVPCGANATSTGYPPLTRDVPSGRPVAAFHSRTKPCAVSLLLLAPTAASVRPSRLQVDQATNPWTAIERISRGCGPRRQTRSQDVAGRLTPLTRRSRPLLPNATAPTTPGTAANVCSRCSVLAFQRETFPVVLPTAMALLSGLIARVHVCCVGSVLIAWNEGGKLRLPVRSQPRTLLSKLPV